MSGGGQLWRGVGTGSLLAATGVAVPVLPSEPVGLRLLALAGAVLVLVGLAILIRVVGNLSGRRPRPARR